MRLLLFFVFSFGVSAMLAGCSVPVRLNIDDDAAINYSVRSVVRLDGTRRAGGVELEYGHLRASDKQTLQIGERATFDSASVLGPVELLNTARVNEAHVAYNHVFFSQRPVELELIGGIGGVWVDWRAQPLNSSQAAIEKRYRWGGFVLGVGPRWKISRYFALEGRLTSVFGSIFNEDAGYKTGGEVAVSLSPVKQVRIKAGYTRSTTRFERDAANQSPISIKAQGPHLGLALEF